MTERGARGSGVLIMFGFFPCMLVPWVCSLPETIGPYAHVHFSVCVLACSGKLN